MNVTSLVGHILELLEAADASTVPDVVAAEFFRRRKYLGSHDRRYITSAFFSIIRHRRYLETLLHRYRVEESQPEDFSAPADRFFPLFLILLAAVEQRSMEEIVEAAGSRWRMQFPRIDLAQFIASIERNRELPFLPPGSDEFYGVRHSFPDWMVRRWRVQFPDEIDPLLEVFNAPAKTVLRVNLLKCTREECRTRLTAEGIETDISTLSPSGLITTKRFNKNASDAFREGWYEIQDEGSQLVSLLLPLHPGLTVIDACAGAGGKTLHLAELMGDDGNIIAIDIDRLRLDELGKRSGRAGLRCIHPYLREEFPRSEFEGKADIVLIDAPCSGDGTIRRNPGLKWSITESLVRHFSEIQSGILDENSIFVKSGGTLAYVTCSLFRQENEELIHEFLSRHADFSLDHPRVLPPLTPNPDGTINLLPHRLDTDGFFIALLKKK